MSPAPNSQTIALTGATGFIGTAVLRSLLAAGYRVKVLIRDPRAPLPKKPKFQIVYGRIEDPRAISELLDETDGIVNCAGSVRGRNLADFEAANVVGPEHLAKAISQSAHPPYLVHISSLAARHPELSDYAQSKALGEENIKALSSRFSIIRPPAVYGAQDKELKPVFDMMRKGLSFVPGSGNGHFSLLHVEDLADAVLQLLRSQKRIEHPLELDDGKENGHTWTTLASTVRGGENDTGRLIRIPHSVLSFSGSLNVIFSKLIRYSPMLTPGKANELTHENWVSNRDNWTEIDWKPTISLRNGIERIYNA